MNDQPNRNRIGPMVHKWATFTATSLAAVPGWAWFTLAAPLLTLAHIWAGVVGQLLVHWIYTDWSRPNLAFYTGCGWLAVSLATWGVAVLRVAERTGVVARIAQAASAVTR